MRQLKERIKLGDDLYFDPEYFYCYTSKDDLIVNALTDTECKIIKFLCLNAENNNNGYVSNKELFKVVKGIAFERAYKDMYNREYDSGYTISDLMKPVTSKMSVLRQKEIRGIYLGTIIEAENGRFKINLPESPFNDNIDQYEIIRNPIAFYLIKYKHNKKSLSKLRYDAQNTDFIGRNKEMDRLLRFIRDDRSLLWWAITGSGGVGKSRLAFELKNHLDNSKGHGNGGSWISVMVEWNQFYKHIEDKLKQIDEWNTNNNYLIIIDYVQSYEKEIASFIESLAGLDYIFGKVRVLMLERVPISTDRNNSYPLWYSSFKNGWSNIKHLDDTCYNRDFIKLSGIDDFSAREVVKSFIESQGRSALTKDTEKIVSYVKRINNNEISPLLLLCAADIWLSDSSLENAVEKISKLEIWQNMIDKEKREITSKIESDLESDAMIDLLAIATIVHRLSLNNKVIDDIFTISRFCRYYGMEKKIISIANSSKYAVKTDSDKYFNLAAIEPDIIGEYFVYTVLKDFNESEYAELFAVLNKRYPNETKRFIWRYISDFGSVVSTHPGYLCILDSIYNTVTIGADTSIEDIHHTINATIRSRFTDIRLTAQNNDGSFVECIMLFTFRLEETGKRYILFCRNNESNIFMYEFEPIKERIAPIATEEEYAIVEAVAEIWFEEGGKDILKALNDNNDDHAHNNDNTKGKSLKTK